MIQNNESHELPHALPFVEIRPMRLEHLAEVMEIEPVAFGSHHWSHQSFVNELNNSLGCYFVAYERGTQRLIGYSGFWLIGEEAHITTLAVHPEWRRLNIGERLLIHDINQAYKVGANWLTLEVRASNEKAQMLYFKYGFKSLGVRRNYYQDNDEDAYVLWTENIRTPEFKKQFQERVDALQQLLGANQSDFENSEKPVASHTPLLDEQHSNAENSDSAQS
ncbi:MAG: ribosomal protein S18-alanine N-acetyltransferase [Candidatus Obscuribacterales bacterium]|nr:ribosomal protein S18-alanine N-acetyltransferase [Candidatus Obscuribacterales bacterium]